MIKCKFKYSVEKLNSKTNEWEIEYRFYYLKLPSNHIDFKSNNVKRNLTFLEELNEGL